MTLPSWQNKKFGGKIRAALWLESVVGEGEIFTKARLRQAFPGEAQIDRRLRDLRSHGWQIHTNRDDPSLKMDEQRYVRKGAEIWIPGEAKSPPHKNSITAAQRAKVMAADDFLCRTCGIGAGESYGDAIDQAQLNVARRPVLTADRSVQYQLVTECKRCSSVSADKQEDAGELLSQLEALSPLERKVFAGWMATDRRQPSALERLWGRYRTLPEESRKTIMQAMTSGDE